jgi:hypothetical protein
VTNVQHDFVESAARKAHTWLRECAADVYIDGTSSLKTFTQKRTTFAIPLSQWKTREEDAAGFPHLALLPAQYRLPTSTHE